MTQEHLSSSKDLTLKDFHFEVPAEQVAQKPLAHRDDAKLLVWKNNSVEHSTVSKLVEHIPDGSLFILNDSKVIASRIRFLLPTGGQAEFLLLEPTDFLGEGAESWQVLGRPVKRFKIGLEISIGHGLTATIVSLPKSGGEGPEPFVVQFSLTGPKLLEWLERHGEMPLPPYIERKSADASVKDMDRSRYQTVYAGPEGSVAAPTAGLHFTPEVLSALKQKQCTIETVTLHVGAGTFLPVKTSDVTQHVMHTERFLIPRKTLDAIARAKSAGKSVIVVGTTALRSLEGLHKLSVEQKTSHEDLSDRWLRTNIFIHPKNPHDRYKSWVADGLMTNFHQPESTLFMLICALIGYHNAVEIYKTATARSYRFFSYGDSSLLWLKA